MHLVGPHLTTTSYKKRKQKVTKVQQELWRLEWQKQCKRYKQIGLKPNTFEEYVDLIHGRVKKTAPKFEQLKVKPDTLNEERMKKHKEMYPSKFDFGSTSGTCAKKEPQKYTGTLIKGIATMHKSNAVPILNQEDAVDISKMRR